MKNGADGCAHFLHPLTWANTGHVVLILVKRILKGVMDGREGSISPCHLTLIYEQPCPFPYHKSMNGGQQDLRSALETTPAKRGHCLGWCGHCWCKIGLQNKHIPSSHYNKSIISSSILDNYERFGIYIEFSSDLDQADFCSSNRLDLGSKNVKALLTHIIKKK